MEIKAAGNLKPAPALERPGQGTGRSKFVEALREIEKGENFLNRIMARAMRGKDFSTQELIAVQAGVYHYAHRLEIFSKLVDRATASVHKLMNP
jgi:hypothetical protein